VAQQSLPSCPFRNYWIDPLKIFHLPTQCPVLEQAKSQQKAHFYPKQKSP